MAVNVIRKYLKKKGVSLGQSVEETMNRFLETLSRDPENKYLGMRDELFSAAAVTLTGLRRVKDPVKLYKNLVAVFEERGICIFTPTVKSAFIRLQNDAIKQGKEKEIQRILRKTKNISTKSILSPKLSANFLKELMKVVYKYNMFNEPFIRHSAAVAFASKAGISKSKVKKLLKHEDSGVREAAAEALASRKDLQKKELRTLLTHSDKNIRIAAARTYASRPDFTAAKFNEFVREYKRNRPAKIGVAQGYAFRKDLPPKELNRICNHPDPDINFISNYAVAPKKEVKKREISSTLWNIRGKRGKRTRRIKKLTAPLRKKTTKRRYRAK